MFVEAVHRIGATLADMVDAFGADREAFVGRELTKLHEQCVVASLGELLDAVGSGAIASKGEFVVAVSGATGPAGTSLEVDRLLVELLELVPARQAAAIAARITGGRRNALYDRILELAGD